MPYDIQQKLIAESGRIGPDIYQRTLNSSPWLKLVKQDSFPEEMGDTISVLTYERSLPTYPLAWANVGQSNDPLNTPGGGSCLPPNAVVDFAQTLRTYNLQQTSLNSPPLCVNDLRVAFKRKEQLGNMMSVLTDNTAYAWVNRYRDEYARIVQHQVSLTAGFPDGGGAGVPLVAPTYSLSQGILKKFYQHLIRDGAWNNPLDRVNGQPVFGLICSGETSDNLIKANVDIRQDYRWSGKVNELLAPMGIERSYGGFFHMIEDLPPRWNFTAGAWVRVQPYVGVAATKGTGAQLDPLYENASYEDSFIFHTDVYTSLVAAPISGPGGGTKFDPVSYRGDFSWKNIPHATDNPDGTIGFFRAIYMNASKPVFPMYGYVIRHLRCDVPLGITGCVQS